MHSLLIFVGLLTLSRLDLSESRNYRFGGNVDKNLNAKFKPPWPKAVLFGAKVNLAMAKIDLSSGTIGLTVAEVDLSGDAVDVSKPNADSFGCKDNLESSGNKIDLKILTPSAFTYCLTVTLTVNDKQERLEKVNEVLNSTSKFAIEVVDGGSRLILHNYKEEFGKSFSWVEKPAECCVSWLGSTKEFHLYLEGKHVLGGTGQLEWGSDKMEEVVLEGQTREAVNGPITELKQWDRVLNKDEVQQVSNRSLRGDIVKEKPPNWMITADNITEPFQRGRRCPHPTTFKYDEEKVTLRYNSRNMIQLPRPRTKKLEELSLCLWAYFEFRSSTSLSMLDYLDDDRNWILDIRVKPNETLYNWKRDEQQITAPALQPEEWHHLCFTWSEIRNGTVDIYHDGKLALHTQVKKGSSHIAGEVHFSYVRYKPFNPKNPSDGYELKAIGINIWDYALNPYEVLQSYECPAEKPGNILSWATSGKTYNGTVW